MAQLKTLFALEYGGAATIGQTADRLGISLPTASHLVDRLVQSGFVERTEDPADRRRTLATVSAKGSELTRRLRQGGRESLTEWLAQLDDTVLEELARSISRLAEVAVAGSCTVSDRTPVAQAR
jgi:DNA-binding MarR family transcriptional regulator